MGSLWPEFMQFRLNSSRLLIDSSEISPNYSIQSSKFRVKFRFNPKQKLFIFRLTHPPPPRFPIACIGQRRRRMELGRWQCDINEIPSARQCIEYD